VPVFNRDGTTVAALSISVRAERIASDGFRELMLPLLRRAQTQLAKTLYTD
jgi:DNA-binding IclR family transcriptional regulator